MSSAATGNFLDFVKGSGSFVSNGNAAAAGSPLNPNAAQQEYFETDDISSARGGKGNGNGKNKDNTDDGGTATVTETYISGDPTVDDSLEFNIKIEFMGDSWTQELMDSFIAAADYLSSIIKGDLTDIFYDGELIDDIVIQASLTDIDGEGGILGQAGPTVVRTADYLPLMGIMEFDVADAQVYDDLYQ